MSAATPTLYAISAEHRRILEAIDANGGELTPELEAALDSSSGSLADKLDSCRAWLAQIRLERAKNQAMVDQIMQEAKPFSDRVQADDRRINSLEAYMQRSLEASGETRVDGLFSFRLQTNPLSVKWDGPMDLVPKRFLRTKVVEEIDKTALLKAHKADEELPEQAVFFRTMRLVIK